jgi:hypothetical protein
VAQSAPAQPVAQLGVAGLLSTIPAAVADEDATIRYGNVDGALSLAGIARPDPAEASFDDYKKWLLQLDSAIEENVIALLPREIANPIDDDLREEIGFTSLDITEFAVIEQLPDSIVVCAGVAADQIDGVLGNRVDNVWQLGDGSIDAQARTEFRSIGQTMYLGSRDSLVAYTAEPDHLAAWLSADDSLVSDPRIQSMVGVFESASVYSATIVRSNGGFVDPQSASLDVQPWSAVGLGFHQVVNGSDAVLVYHHDRPEDAVANADVIVAEFLSGGDGLQPWVEIATIVDVEVVNSDVIVRFRTTKAIDLELAMIGSAPLIFAGFG